VDKTAADLVGVGGSGQVLLDWRLGFDAMASGGSVVAAPRLAFGVGTTATGGAIAPVTLTVGGKSVRASIVERQESGKTLYDLKIETVDGSLVSNQAMEDFLRQVGFSYRGNIDTTPPVAHDLKMNVSVKLSADGLTYFGAPAGQAGVVEVEFGNVAPQFLEARHAGSRVVLFYKEGDLAGADLADVTDGYNSWLGNPLKEQFTVAVTLSGQTTADSSFEVVDVLLNREVYLFLNKEIPTGATVTVRYVDPNPTTDNVRNVVQDWRGNDVLSMPAPVESKPFTGWEAKALSGASLGVQFDGGEFPFGVYVQGGDGAGIQLDTPAKILAVGDTTYTVELRPTELFANPSYQATASKTGSPRSFVSYEFSNEVARIELVKKTGQSYTGGSRWRYRIWPVCRRPIW
jgi:hypothetical protein